MNSKFLIKERMIDDMMGYRNGYGYGMMGYGNSYGMMGGGFFWFIPLILIIIAIVAIYVISSRRKNRNVFSNDSSIEILNQRYARGEINEEQYIKMRDIIKRR
jgi:putative membrane protein